MHGIINNIILNLSLGEDHGINSIASMNNNKCGLGQKSVKMINGRQFVSAINLDR